MDRYLFEEKNYLGDRLRELRLTFGFKQSDVAEALNVSRSTYSYYETGSIRPDPAILGKLALYYDIPVGFFYGETEQGLVLRDPGDLRRRSSRLAGDEMVHVGELFPSERSLILFLRSNEYVDAQSVLEELRMQVARIKEREKQETDQEDDKK